MRLPKIALLASVLATLLAIPALSSRAQDTDDPSRPRGRTAPRSSAEKYHAHAQHGGVSIGAELLTRKHVSQVFAADLNRCCLVVQVAVYPKRDELLDLSLDDFTLIVEGSDTPVRPESATVVAAKLEKKSSNPGITTSGSVGVGYESGTYIDPVTGRPVRVRGVTTSAGVGVGVGGGAPPAVADRDREVIDRELSEKGLPEAKIAIPVSGYLYFSLPKQKSKQKSGQKPAQNKYRLEYVLKGESLTLHLP